MSEPRIRFKQPVSAGGLHVDYRDVLEQAVANERFRVIREVRQRAEKIKVTEVDPYHSYSSKDRTASTFKTELFAALESIEGTRG